ncbi:Alpha/Beta hydrolase protein [Mycena leptocephala]|nr:Alpha/Beta hydrolase protein [Mycena leptocephala]
MLSSLTLTFLFTTAFVTLVHCANPVDSFHLTPFSINLTSGIPRLRALVNSTRLPAKPLYPTVGQEKGIELDVLEDLRSNWLHSFNWETQQAELNEFNHYTAVIEGQTVHFIHERSTDTDAIPVILVHGWPGSFQEFLPVIKPLTQSWTSPTGKKLSYNVVVPSLPGFVFSSAPPLNWTVNDTARIFNTLMTDVLGYSTYAVHSTDWNVTQQRSTDWNTIGKGYLDEQTTKPNDIGLALYDSPVGQLAWIGAKFKLWSDPRAGNPPSVLTHTSILTSVSLYYLTDSFLSAVWIYAQNANGFPKVYTKAPTDAPMLFSQYEYNIGFWPEDYVSQVGNLVSYKFHDFGGHFAGLDNPPTLIKDIREMGTYFRGELSAQTKLVNEAQGFKIWDQLSDLDYEGNSLFVCPMLCMFCLLH